MMDMDEALSIPQRITDIVEIEFDVDAIVRNVQEVLAKKDSSADYVQQMKRLDHIFNSAIKVQSEIGMGVSINMMKSFIKHSLFYLITGQNNEKVQKIADKLLYSRKGDEIDENEIREQFTDPQSSDNEPTLKSILSKEINDLCKTIQKKGGNVKDYLLFRIRLLDQHLHFSKAFSKDWLSIDDIVKKYDAENILNAEKIYTLKEMQTLTQNSIHNFLEYGLAYVYRHDDIEKIDDAIKVHTETANEIQVLIDVYNFPSDILNLLKSIIKSKDVIQQEILILEKYMILVGMFFSEIKDLVENKHKLTNVTLLNMAIAMPNKYVYTAHIIFLSQEIASVSDKIEKRRSEIKSSNAENEKDVEAVDTEEDEQVKTLQREKTELENDLKRIEKYNRMMLDLIKDIENANPLFSDDQKIYLLKNMKEYEKSLRFSTNIQVAAEEIFNRKKEEEAPPAPKEMSKKNKLILLIFGYIVLWIVAYAIISNPKILQDLVDLFTKPIQMVSRAVNTYILKN
ncbi:hypothetical protein NEMIN01_1866 [Nematocida minor]|uniref:uncharacterized protein n=1 Tax=Nematocida minor TaxID=1912983 RepID=UPI00221F16AA|nr:uncharacterized protein NEMIN01_1866 [Nematocida minor]KAI5192197.1 hypothetical protein NEMIN01_1866 [Nematocida minor]